MQLSKFFSLCEDGVWGVRKACADVFMPVSCVCSPAVRQAELSPLFINLLRDQSRWVRMAAFQALGPFISTFSRPRHDPSGQETAPFPQDASMDSDSAPDFDADFNSFSYWRDPLPELDLLSLHQQQPDVIPQLESLE